MLDCEKDTESCVCWLTGGGGDINRNEVQFFLSTYGFLVSAFFVFTGYIQLLGRQSAEINE